MICQRNKFLVAGNHEYQKTDSIKKEFIVVGNHEYEKTYRQYKERIYSCRKS